MTRISGAVRTGRLPGRSLRALRRGSLKRRENRINPLIPLRQISPLNPLRQLSLLSLLSLVKLMASKQAKPGKSAGSDKSGKPAKKAENPAEYDESGEQSQSVKTPSVMRLVEERAFSENQVVAAGKSLIPRQLRGIEPLSKVMRREAELQRGEQPDDEVSRSPLVMRELTEMVIAENVPGIIRRFNACDCEKCMSELARLTAEEIPARYMKMPELADLNWSGFSSDERMLIDSLKKNAVTVMIRLMIANKKRNFH